MLSFTAVYLSLAYQDQRTLLKQDTRCIVTRSSLCNLRCVISKVSAERQETPVGDVTSRIKTGWLAFDFEKLDVDRQPRLAIPTADHSDT